MYRQSESFLRDLCHYRLSQFLFERLELLVDDFDEDRFFYIRFFLLWGDCTLACIIIILGSIKFLYQVFASRAVMAGRVLGV